MKAITYVCLCRISLIQNNTSLVQTLICGSLSKYIYTTPYGLSLSFVDTLQ